MNIATIAIISAAILLGAWIIARAIKTGVNNAIAHLFNHPRGNANAARKPSAKTRKGDGKGFGK